MSNPSNKIDIKAEQKIELDKASYIKEIIKIDELDSSLNSLVKELKTYKQSVSPKIQGTQYLEAINLETAPLPSAFTIVENLDSIIYYTDNQGNVWSYNSKDPKNSPQQVVQNQAPLRFIKIDAINLKSSKNFILLGGITSDFKFRKLFVTANTEKNISLWKDAFDEVKVSDFNGSEDVIFLVLSESGILQITNILSDNSYKSPSKFAATIQFQAVSLDEQNKKLYALDKQIPNNLYIFTLNEQFMVDPANMLMQKISFSNSLFLNNLRVGPQNPHTINDPNNKIYFIGTTIKPDGSIDDSKLINFYSGTLNYSSNNKQNTPELILTSLVDKDFNGRETFLNENSKETKNSDVIAQLFEDFGEKLEKLDFNNNLNSLISFDLDENNKYLYVLLNNKIISYPIYSRDSQEDITTFYDLTKFPITKVNEQIDLINKEISKSLETINKLDSKLIENKDDILMKRIANLQEEVEKLEKVKKEKEKLGGQIITTSIKYNSIYLQYLFWILIGIITLILVVLNFFIPDVISIDIIIIYTLFIAILIFLNRKFLTIKFNDYLKIPI